MADFDLNNLSDEDLAKLSGRQLLTQALRSYSSPYDVNALNQMAQQRQQQYEKSLINSLAAGLGGKRMEPVRDVMLKQAMSNYGDQDIGGGYLSGGKFVEDPYAASKRQYEALTGFGKEVSKAEQDALEREAEAERDRLNRAAQAKRDREELKGTWLQVTDPETGQVVLFNNKTGQTKPFVFPESGPKKPEDKLQLTNPGFSIPGTLDLKLPEGQEKNRYFAENIAQSLPEMVSAINKKYVPTKDDRIAAGVPAFNWKDAALSTFYESSQLSPEARTYWRAAKQILQSVLRKESGGAITRDEWIDYGPVYLPWPGDSEEERHRKIINLKKIADNMAVGSGKAKRFWKSPEVVFDISESE